MNSTSQLRPMLSALQRHKGAALLIVVNVALTCALVGNALHLAGMRLATMLADGGWPADEVLVQKVRAEDEPAQTQRSTTVADLARLRALAGVRAAAIVNQVPWAGYYSRYGVGRADAAATDKGASKSSSAYLVSSGFIEAMGVRLVQGRDFLPAERIAQQTFDHGMGADESVPAVILNAALARALFPDGSAVGQLVRLFGTHAVPVVGVVEGLHPAEPQASEPYAILLPLEQNYGAGFYMLRVEPGQQAAVTAAAGAALRAAEPRRNVRPAMLLSEVRHEVERDDRVMAAMFAGVVAALLTVTACGIVGLASFWVQQRTRQIGIRRALGATAADVRRYFQLENALLTGAGVVLGTVGAVLLGAVLKAHWEVPALPWWYLPLGAAVLLLLGQLAVLGPAVRAARVPPVVALRS